MTTIVMNTENAAVTQYDWTFDSLTPTHGTKTSGLFALGGNTDDGVAIASRALTPATDLGSNGRKAVDKCFIGVQGSGRGLLLVQDHNETYEYPVEVQRSGLSRAEPGRGIDANYLAFGYANVAGADFILDRLDAPILESKQRRTA